MWLHNLIQQDFLNKLNKASNSHIKPNPTYNQILCEPQIEHNW